MPARLGADRGFWASQGMQETYQAWDVVAANTDGPKFAGSGDITSSGRIVLDNKIQIISRGQHGLTLVVVIERPHGIKMMPDDSFERIVPAWP